MFTLWPVFLLALIHTTHVCGKSTFTLNHEETLIENEPAGEFSHYTIVKPIIYHGRHKREITNEIEELFHHPDQISILLPIDNEDFILDLVINNQIISENYFRKTQEDGLDKIDRFSFKETKSCHYSGKVRNKPDSWVALSTCDGLSGLIYDGHKIHYIEKNKDGDENEHFLYKGQNLAINEPKHRHKRTSSISLFKEPYNANSESKYVELVLCIDNMKYKELNSSVELTENYSKNIVNIMNALFYPLNIFVVLVGVDIWTERDEIQFDLVTFVWNFLDYRRDKLVKIQPNDNAQLITKRTFLLQRVGRAPIGSICTETLSGGVSMDTSPLIGRTATIVTHMLGHNLGLQYDTCDCTCPEKICIMDINSEFSSARHFSSCAQKNLKFSHGMGWDRCLENKPKFLFKGPVCGNGFREEGEECDCGPPGYCTNNCCEPSSCKKKETVKCASEVCCDIETCSWKKNVTCREATNECDLPEYCSGKSEFCPEDVHKRDQVPCKEGESFCYKGQCNTYLDRCKFLWGDTAVPSVSQCHELNTEGNKHGHCGYDRIKKIFTKCNTEDVACGALHCEPPGFYLKYGYEFEHQYGYTYLNVSGSLKLCQTITFLSDMGDPDKTMVPNGAKCGEGKMCLNQKCISVQSEDSEKKLFL